jgi:hypothetical protein
MNSFQVLDMYLNIQVLWLGINVSWYETVHGKYKIINSVLVH